MRYLLVGIALLVAGCVEKEDSVYIQEQEIKLAQPKISVANTIIDSFVIVRATLRMEKTEIRYTADGSDPIENSPLYDGALTIIEEGLYRFRTFNSNWLPSDIVDLRLFRKGHQVSGAEWQTSAHDSYPGDGVKTLINNIKASENFRDTQWVGFDTVAKAEVFFDKRPYMESISLGYLIDTKSWIFPPEAMTVVINNADTVRVDLGIVLEKETLRLAHLKVPIGQNVESLMISVENLRNLPLWHSGKGNKAWLFMDELIFN